MSSSPHHNRASISALSLSHVSQAGRCDADVITTAATQILDFVFLPLRGRSAGGSELDSLSAASDTHPSRCRQLGVQRATSQLSLSRIDIGRRVAPRHRACVEELCVCGWSGENASIRRLKDRWLRIVSVVSTSTLTTTCDVRFKPDAETEQKIISSQFADH